MCSIHVVFSPHVEVTSFVYFNFYFAFYFIVYSMFAVFVDSSKLLFNIFLDETYRISTAKNSLPILLDSPFVL